MILGLFFGLAAAIGYTAANIFLRQVASCDPVWVSCIKTIPTIALIGPWLIVVSHRGGKLLPTRKRLIVLILAGLLGQLGGNVCFQWSLGVVGIALAVPICIGVIIVSGAIMGRAYLSEIITWRAAFAAAVLIVAIFVLSLGAPDAYRSIVESTATPSATINSWYLMVGVGAAAFAGFGYSVLGVVIRYSVMDRLAVSTTVVLIATVGLVSLGGTSWLRIGTAGMLETSAEDFSVMILAGICNAIAFGSLGKALELMTINYVNILNASQVAMCAVAGVVFFAEPATMAMVIGVILTMFGLLTMKVEKGELPRS